MEPRLNAWAGDAAARERAAAPPALQLAGLTRLYGGARAVDDFSLELRRGEFLCLLGPSGSGKSTVLRMVAGFEQPDCGSILLDGADITRVSPQQRGIGMVFQNYALFPHMTAAENIAFPLRMRRRSRAEIGACVDRMLHLLQLESLAARYPKQLSGGQQQRVALARALVFEPKLLMMDEPLGALDRQLRRKIQMEIKRIHRNLGVSIIFVTHDQEEAMFLSDRIAVMREGRIVQAGSPAALYAAPNSRFVAAFIGHANFIPAVIESVSGGMARLRFADGSVGGGLCAFAAGAGQRVDCLIRPESIHLATHGAMTMATVELANFLGEAYELSFDTPVGRLCARIPIGGCASLPGPGRKAGITWAPEEVRVFPVREGA